MSLRKFNDWLLLDIILTFWDIINELLNDVETLINLVDVNHITLHRVGTSTGDFLPLHLVVHVVRMILTNIIVPSGSTTSRTSYTIVDTILKVHVTTTLKTLVSDNIITKHIEVFLHHWTHILAECLNILNEVRINIILQTTNTVVVLDKTSTSGFLHNVEQVLTVTHTVKECCKSRKVLSTSTKEEQVVINTLKLIHDCADILDTIVKLNAKSLLDNTNKGVTMMHSAKIVQTIGQSQCLRISHILHHLLKTTMNVAKMWIDMLYCLTINNSLQTKHTVH